jgi:hypothetical protein
MGSNVKVQGERPHRTETYVVTIAEAVTVLTTVSGSGVTITKEVTRLGRTDKRGCKSSQTQRVKAETKRWEKKKTKPRKKMQYRRSDK